MAGIMVLKQGKIGLATKLNDDYNVCHNTKFTY